MERREGGREEGGRREREGDGIDRNACWPTAFQ